MHNQPSLQMQKCIDDCVRCHQICLRMAMNHCLEMGGRHVEPGHFRSMITCAEICRTAADFMLASSPLHAQTCAVCAQVCDACARSCEQVGDMDECVRACRQCADSCRQQAGLAGQSLQGSSHAGAAF